MCSGTVPHRYEFGSSGPMSIRPLEKLAVDDERTATAGSDVVQSGRQFSMTFQHLWPYIGNNTANVIFLMVKRLWLIRIDEWIYIASEKIV
ncbi:hypothetical protein TNCV_3657151 [Trichonephila clavipes]|nr:hypothetical protein TNCV_3657151 [Trichonephila clavipes]